MSLDVKISEFVGTGAAVSSGIYGLVTGKISIYNDLHSLLIAALIATTTGFCGFIGTLIARRLTRKYLK